MFSYRADYFVCFRIFAEVLHRVAYILIRHVEASDVDLRGVAYLDARGVGYEYVAAERCELSVDFGYRSVRARYVVEGVEAFFAYEVYSGVRTYGEIAPFENGCGTVLLRVRVLPEILSCTTPAIISGLPTVPLGPVGSCVFAGIAYSGCAPVSEVKHSSIAYAIA